MFIIITLFGNSLENLQELKIIIFTFSKLMMKISNTKLQKLIIEHFILLEETVNYYFRLFTKSAG